MPIAGSTLEMLLYCIILSKTMLIYHHSHQPCHFIHSVIVLFIQLCVGAV